MSDVPQWHEGGSFFGLGSNAKEPPTSAPSVFDLPKEAKRDPIVSWSHKTAGRMRAKASGRLRDIKRNVDFFNGNQWSKNRAKWKNNVVLNYASWICEQWTALLCDNKPKFVYSAARVEDEPQAAIATALREFDAARDDWDRKREEAILMSRVKKEAFYTLRYDPNLYGGQGGVTLKIIDPENFFRDNDDVSLDENETILYEYYESPGSLMSRFPKLKLAVERDQGYAEGRQAAAQVSVPAQYSTSTSGDLYSQAHTAPAADRPGGGPSTVRVREWWLRPKGRKNEIIAKRVRWTAQNKIATRKKFLQMADGSFDPLQIVVTEGNIVYELPKSVVDMMQFAADAYDGVKIISVADAVSVMYEERRVLKYPAGRRIIVVGDYVADDGGNPFAHQEVPFAHTPARINGRTGKILGDIDLVHTQLETLNRLVAIIVDTAMQTSNPVWIVPIDEQMSDEDLTNAPGAIIKATPMAAKLMRRENGANLPNYIMGMVQFIVGQIREISGLSETATGGKFKGQQSAETVSMYQESASVRFRQAIRIIEQTEVRLGRQYVALCGQFYSEPMMVTVKNALGYDQHIDFLGSDLTRNMMMKAKAGSGLPSSPSARLNTTMSMYQAGMTDLIEVLKVLEENGSIESANQLLKRIDSYVQNPIPANLVKMPALAKILGGAGGQPGGQKNTANAGRSARSMTANKARA